MITRNAARSIARAPAPWLFPPFILFLILVACSPRAAFAQSPGITPEALQSFQSMVSGILPEEEIEDLSFAPYSEGDEEIGVQALLEKKKPDPRFNVQASGTFYWTDNANFSEQNQLEDTYFSSHLRAAFLPKLTEALYGNVFVRHEAYRYDQNNFLDFDDFETGIGIAGKASILGGLSVFSHYSYEHLEGVSNNTSVSEHSFDIGFFKSVDITEKQSAYFRFKTALGIATNPGTLRRNEYDSLLGYRYKICDKVSLNAYYRLRHLDYQGQPGNDWNHQPGLSILCQANDWLSLAASASITVNDSSRPGGDYTAGSLGGFFTLQVSF